MSHRHFSRPDRTVDEPERHEARVLHLAMTSPANLALMSWIPVVLAVSLLSQLL
ncbi:hypothetical protein [Thalassorhabdomicrobium marinisediminis]|uniref:hypothetical protein n=1 Tax=Thalassorhabdomicrobium marinisediminis TaxID=2170577 RepID=UPI00248FDDFF|nr:hypothetical protein [Thalassorhabdomicrobium marinisediminis]